MFMGSLSEEIQMAEFVQDHLVEGMPIRELQDALVEAFGADAWRYTQRLSRDKVTGSTKVGKHWHIGVGPRWDEWVDEMAAKAVAQVGGSITADLDDGDQLPGVRVAHATPLDRSVWKAYMERFRSGEVHTVFVPADAVVVAYKMPDGSQVRVELAGVGA